MSRFKYIRLLIYYVQRHVLLVTSRQNCTTFWWRLQDEVVTIVGRIDRQTELEIVVEIGRKLESKLLRKLVTILSYTIALCNDIAEVQDVLSYPLRSQVHDYQDPTSQKLS